MNEVGEVGYLCNTPSLLFSWKGKRVGKKERLLYKYLHVVIV